MRLSRIFKTWRVTAGVVIAELFGGLIVNGDLSATGSITGTGASSHGTRLTEPLTTLVYGPSIAIDASLANLFVVTITDAVAFVTAAPTNPPAGSASQVITITYRNASGGAHGAGTWNAIFKTQATVFSAIANGFSRSMSFRWNGTNWVELVRTAADIAN
jgi:hypothetical protein